MCIKESCFQECAISGHTALLVLFLLLVKYLIKIVNNRLEVFSDVIAGSFNRSGTTPAIAIDMSKALDRLWHASLVPEFRSYGISSQEFGLI